MRGPVRGPNASLTSHLADGTSERDGGCDVAGVDGGAKNSSCSVASDKPECRYGNLATAHTRCSGPHAQQRHWSCLATGSHR